MKQWERSPQYFEREGKLFDHEDSEDDTLIIPEEETLEKCFDDAAPEIDEKEATAVKVLIRRILQYDPAKRPTASELLQDPWFRGIDDAGNLTL
ncbi:hypothetical protein SEPCBS119000_006742 [Sporothrix epigloea]|uniref:Protein kinase domain-containing protein n=1 Tax=Sporothrix epigloea TaxID=1892477 RepID=A0ABP0E7U4_9PEZI